MKNSSSKINASSMADIAFLLLIFFLVSTTIDQDKGILNKLPPLDVENTEKIRERNILDIHINGINQLMVNQEQIDIATLRTLTIKHLKNNGALLNFSEKPEKAIVFLKNDRATSYQTYIMVQNELKAAYNQVRNEEALALSGQQYNYQGLKTCIENKTPDVALCKKLKQQVQKKYPMHITEALPRP